ncbi:MAG TPA: choice-of-anchor Q domain-containing protein, partial [Puia sp.]|nr:choice-of-anchor Q domain-containing protein [Puia sp.]
MIATFTRILTVLTVLLLSLQGKTLATTFYVNSSNPTPGSGLTWATAFNDLNAALAAAESSAAFTNTIWVAKGTYKPTTTTDRTATFLLKGPLWVYGGFIGTETALGQQDPVANPTILSGDIGVPGDPSDNSYHVVTFENYNSGTWMNGFTIEYGNANAGYPASTTPQADNTGGGVLLLTNPNDNNVGWMQYCTITNNFAVYGGGYGAYGDGTGTTGGNTFSYYKVNNCTFTNNSAWMGGAFGVVAANQVWFSGTIQNCIFTNNSSTGGQGSVVASVANNAYSNVTNNFNNSVLYNNPQPIAYNQSTSSATPAGKSYIWITNDIVWQSGAPYAGPLNTGPNSTDIDFSNCDLDLVTPLGSNLDADPQFINAAGGDFHVAHCTSPVIDQGWPVGNMVNYDMDGNPRVQGTAIDIGAYEQSHPLAPTVPNPTVSYCPNATAAPLTATAAAGNTLL